MYHLLWHHFELQEITGHSAMTSEVWVEQVGSKFIATEIEIDDIRQEYSDS